MPPACRRPLLLEQDLKIPLEEQGAKLGQVVFHAARIDCDKALRVGKWLPDDRQGHGRFFDVRAAGDEGPGRNRCRTEKPHCLVGRPACRALAKADLVTSMVGEFPEYRGLRRLIGPRPGQPDAVADAVRDHYRPIGQQDEIPAAPVTIALALADKIDTLAAFYSIGEKPTGSRDPFALRRAALGVLQIITRHGLRLSLRDILIQAAVLVKLSRLGALASASFPNLWADDDGDHEITAEVGSFTYRSGGTVVARWDASRTPKLERGRFIEEAVDVEQDLFAFFIDRLKVQQRESGVRHDLIDVLPWR